MGSVARVDNECMVGAASMVMVARLRLLRFTVAVVEAVPSCNDCSPVISAQKKEMRGAFLSRHECLATASYMNGTTHRPFVPSFMGEPTASAMNQVGAQTLGFSAFGSSFW